MLVRNPYGKKNAEIQYALGLAGFGIWNQSLKKAILEMKSS